ncbi:MAG: GNAT family N-acetyltransferase [Cupriavidus sp.]|nr:GNAT family N-acetyltransferase [Cupriavidus sp.]MCA3704401.1 GNAT family N-acetyltransferase [Methylobacterium sp.]
MTDGPANAFLRRLSDGAAIEAQIHEPITPAHLEGWQATWRSAIESTRVQLAARQASPSEYPESAHWDWNKKIAVLGGFAAYRTFALIAEGDLQGLMVVETVQHRARLNDEQGRRDLNLVYVEFLEAAPWNRPEHARPVRFRGTGSVLIAAAIQVSRDEGYRGRLGLHSLPQSEPFYRNTIGMQDFGPDDGYPGKLRYFEMTARVADDFLKRGA